MRFLILPAVLLLLACSHDNRPILNGRVEAYLTDLGPRVGGRLVELKVVEGQRVMQGDLLARVAAEELDAVVDQSAASLRSAQARSQELEHGTRHEDIAQGQARVHDAEAALRLAEDTLTRTRQLFGDKVLSKADLDKAQADRDRAAANLNLQQKSLAELLAGARIEQRQGAMADTQRAKAALKQSQVTAGFTEIRAPFDGIVTHRLREVGSVLTPGQPVITLARVDELWVRVYLPQPIQAQASQGMPVTVSVPGGLTLQATLDEVAIDPEYTPKMVETREERVNLVYPARVHLARGWDKGLLPGVAVDVRLGAPPAAEAKR
ncbi:MAG TPA: HlyD family efflux transporter periplasmic adaptor subunit [Holophagaceae bacterium]|nr:HlyD family efflux transporter periplasmic adaptor subunit [Holophagaceae bacterium]